MNTYVAISKELRSFFSKHPAFRILLPLDALLIFGGVSFMTLNSLFPGMGLGSGFFGNLFSSVAYWGYLLGLLLAYANFHQQFLYAGFFSYAALEFLVFLKYIRFFNVGYLITAFIFGSLGYLVFKQSVLQHSPQSGNDA